MNDFELLRAIQSAGDLVEGAFYHAVLKSGFDHTHHFSWNTTRKDLDPLKDSLMSESRRGVQRAAALLEDALVLIELTPDGDVRGKVAGSYASSHAALGRLEELLPTSVEDENRLVYTFWRSFAHASRDTKRKVAVLRERTRLGSRTGQTARVRRPVREIEPTVHGVYVEISES